MRPIGVQGAQSKSLPEECYGVAIGLKLSIFTLDPKRLIVAKLNRIQECFVAPFQQAHFRADRHKVVMCVNGNIIVVNYDRSPARREILGQIVRNQGDSANAAS
jgi:hypothetical protein